MHYLLKNVSHYFDQKNSTINLITIEWAGINERQIWKTKWKKQTMCTLLISVCKGGCMEKCGGAISQSSILVWESSSEILCKSNQLSYIVEVWYTAILLLLLYIHSTYLVWFQMFKHIWWDEVFEKLLGVLRARVVIII